MNALRTHARRTRLNAARLSLAALGLAAALPQAAQAQTYSLRTLVNFNYTDGYQPSGGLTLIGGALYGTTLGGGASSVGTVFSVPVGAVNAAPNTLASFNGSNGSYPSGDLTLIGGTLYGTTDGGGAYTDPGTGGTVYSLPLGGGTPTVLSSFDGIQHGSNPGTGLTLSADGKTFYGTTTGGSAAVNNTVFSLPVGGGTPTVLINAVNIGGAKTHLTLSADGSTLYGTTSGGGANNRGSVFSYVVSSGTFTTLASFKGGLDDTVDPYGPATGLTRIGNTLYGITANGGAYDTSNFNGGTVFSVPVGGGPLTVLASLTGQNDRQDYRAGLTLSADGKTFYGTTLGGGAYGDGSVFYVPVGGGTATTLFSFSGTNGAFPEGDLTLSADGSTLYGTTSLGGTGYNGDSLSGDGTVFALSLAAPEPSAWASLGVGCLGVAALVWRGRKRMQA